MSIIRLEGPGFAQMFPGASQRGADGRLTSEWYTYSRYCAELGELQAAAAVAHDAAPDKTNFKITVDTAHNRDFRRCRQMIY